MIVAGLAVAAAALVVFAVAQSTAWLFAGRALQGLRRRHGERGRRGRAGGARAERRRRSAPRWWPRSRRRAARRPGRSSPARSPSGRPRPRSLCYLSGSRPHGRHRDRRTRHPRAARPSGPLAPPAPVGAAGDPRAVRAGGRHRGRGLGSRGAVRLGRPLLRRRSCSTATTSRCSARSPRRCSSRRAPARCWPCALGAHPRAPSRAASGCSSRASCALVAAFPTHSLTLLLVAAVLTGTGHGVAFFGAQAQVNQLAPSDRRGEVTAAFLAVIYGGVAVSVIGVGFLSDASSLQTAVAAFSAAIGAIAALTAGVIRRRSPRGGGADEHGPAERGRRDKHGGERTDTGVGPVEAGVGRWATGAGRAREVGACWSGAATSVPVAGRRAAPGRRVLLVRRGDVGAEGLRLRRGCVRRRGRRPAWSSATAESGDDSPARPGDRGRDSRRRTKSDRGDAGG